MDPWGHWGGSGWEGGGLGGDSGGGMFAYICSGILGCLGRICADGGFYVLGSMCVGVGGVIVML